MILVIGDAMIDRYAFGTVTRVSPEAPVPVLQVSKLEDRDGGALNVLRNVEAMGADARSLFSPSFKTKPVVKQRLIARTQQIGRMDWDEPQEPITKEMVTDLALTYEPTIALLSDYGKGSLARAPEVIEACKLHGMKVFVDPKSSDPRQYGGADLLKPNHYEMQALVGPWRDEIELEGLAHGLCRNRSLGAILMTRGEKGMTLFARGTSIHFEGRHLDLCDVSGAGDVALAAFAVATERGEAPPDAAYYANKAAGISVTRFGTTVVTKAEVFG